MNIVGVEGKSVAEISAEVERGGRFVIFSWCVSLLVITLKRGTDIYFVQAGESAAAQGLKYTLLSLLMGWWGFPFGLVYTPFCVAQNLSGGRDVTREVMRALAA